MTQEQQRGLKRNKRIKQTAIVALTAKGINALSGLITVPVTLGYLGAEQFGIWMALTAFVAFLSFTDLGIGIGLQNALSRCYGNDDKKTPSSLISTALFLTTFLCIALCAFSWFVLPELDITQLIKLSDDRNQLTLLHTTQAFIVAFAISLPLSMVQRIYDAYQDGVVSNGLLAIGRLFSLASVFISVKLQYPLSVMVFLYMTLPFVFLGFGGLYLFLSNKTLRPSIFNVKLKHINQMVRTGGLALSAQVGAAVMTSGPLLLLSSQFGAIAVVPFAITQRLLSVVSLMTSAALMPLWPAYGEAYARNDKQWINKTFKKSLKYTLLIIVPIFIAMSFLGQSIIGWWSNNPNAVPSWSLLMACNIWAFIMAMSRAFSMLLNGTDHFKGQAVYGLILPILALLIGYYYSSSNTLVITLWIMVLAGELLRSVFLWWESSSVLGKINDGK